MDTIRLAAWNTFNAFGHPKHDNTDAATAVIDQFDADIIMLSETTDRKAVDTVEAAEKLASIGHGLGYRTLTIDYTPFEAKGVRNAQTQSLWVRDSVEGTIGSVTCGNRRTFVFDETSSGISFQGLHNEDNSTDTWLDNAYAQLDLDELDAPAVKFGDLNAMIRGDRKALPFRYGGAAIRPIDIKDRYNSAAKAKRLAGMATRMARMADPRRMDVYLDAGYETADPTLQATFHKGPVQFTIDHILMTGDVTSYDFNVVATGLSDHKAILASVERST